MPIRLDANPACIPSYISSECVYLYGGGSWQLLFNTSHLGSTWYSTITNSSLRSTHHHLSEITELKITHTHTHPFGYWQQNFCVILTKKNLCRVSCRATALQQDCASCSKTSLLFASCIPFQWEATMSHTGCGSMYVLHRCSAPLRKKKSIISAAALTSLLQANSLQILGKKWVAVTLASPITQCTRD